MSTPDKSTLPQPLPQIESETKNTTSETTSSKTTIVTMYYFIGDNSTPKSDFLQKAERTMRIAQPMIIFCDESLRQDILDLRIKHGQGHHNTHMETIPIEQLQMYAYRDQIEKNRENFWPTRDSRCPTDVHILLMSKFEFMLRAIDLNPFQTSTFAWMDFGLLGKTMNESTNYTSDDIYTLIDSICAHPRPKITVQMIRAWTPSMYSDLREWFSEYRYPVSGGFFTAEAKVGELVFQKLLQACKDVTVAGFGHSEEMQWPLVIDRYPKLFNICCGDYEDVIHNYYSVTSNYSFCDWIIKDIQDSQWTDRLKQVLISISGVDHPDSNWTVDSYYMRILLKLFQQNQDTEAVEDLKNLSKTCNLPYYISKIGT